MQEVDIDPWGRSYRVVMAKTKGKILPSLKCTNLFREIINTLFPPEDEPNMVVQRNFEPDVAPVERAQEVLEPETICQKKSTGSDGIANVVLSRLRQCRGTKINKEYNVKINIVK